MIRRSKTHTPGLLGLFLLATTAVVPSASDARPLTFPSRADALPDDYYINSRGHAAGTPNAVDYGRLRWDDDADSWSHWHEGAVEPYTHADNTTFGTPLYAPEDGYVLGCFRNTPDSAGPNVDQCDPSCPDDLFAAGNFLIIVSDDDDRGILLAHLEDDTIPHHLCPNPLTDTNSPNASCALPWPDYGSIPDNTRLELVNPGQPYPRVLQGEYVGNIGHTGNSSFPHGHVEVFDFEWDVNGDFCREPGMPIEWNEGFIQDRTPSVPVDEDAWAPMHDEVLVNGNSIVMIPDPVGIQRDQHSYWHDASDPDLTSHAWGGVAAYRDGGGSLDLRSFDVLPSGDIVTQSIRQEGAVLDVSIAEPSWTRSVIASIRGANGLLKLIPYEVTFSGTINRKFGKEVSAGAIGMVDSVESPAHAGVVVAVEDGGGNLKVLDYHVNSSLDITRDYSSSGTGGPISALAITSVTKGFDGVVTAELVHGTGALRVRSFETPTSGGVVNADTNLALLAGTEVDIDTVPVFFGLDEYVVTTLRRDDGTLRLDVWDIGENGEITWLDAADGGPVGSTIQGATIGSGDFLTSVEGPGGLLTLIGWAVHNDGRIRRNATRVGGPINEAFTLDSVASSGHIMTLFTTNTDSLKLQTIEETFDSSL